MATVDGNIILRSGSEDPVILQLLQDDGVTPIDLAGISNLTLRLKNISDGTAKTFTGAKLTVADADNGKIQLAQVAADFPAAAVYEYYVTFTDSGGKAHAVPEDKNYTWRVQAA
jgi:hypothetical protein